MNALCRNMLKLLIQDFNILRIQFSVHLRLYSFQTIVVFCWGSTFFLNKNLCRAISCHQLLSKFVVITSFIFITMDRNVALCLPVERPFGLKRINLTLISSLNTMLSLCANNISLKFCLVAVKCGLKLNAWSLRSIQKSISKLQISNMRMRASQKKKSQVLRACCNF